MSTSRVIAITGGSAGVGRATARAFAQRGDAIALIARGRQGLDAAVEELEAWDTEAVGVAADIADPDAVEAAAARIEATLGPIDVWVNNAMVTVFGPLSELRPEELRRVTEVTYMGAVWGTMSALRRMRARDRGVIVQVGSALSYRAIPLQAPYCAAKHAMRGFSDSVRCELIHDGSNVRITSVHLPGLNTPQFLWGRTHVEGQAQPVPPIYPPEVAAEAIAYAADHDRREVYVGWPTVKAVFGNKIVPGLLDRYLADVAWDGQIDGDERIFDADNLFTPVPGDYGAHGVFTDREKKSSWIDRASVHLGAGAVLSILVGVPALLVLATIILIVAALD